MDQIAVIIPFYQRSAGILKRALLSIAAQVEIEAYDVSVLIVDDASPVAPELDIQGVTMPKNIECHVLKKENGGPASARNHGIESASSADFIAFLDSDDEWNIHHLATAMRAFSHKADCDFFFEDSQENEEITLYQHYNFPVPQNADLEFCDSEIKCLPSQEALHYISSQYISHTSTIVYRKLPENSDLFFPVDQKYTGEDHLMWISLVARSRYVCYTFNIGSKRGRGVDIFRGIVYDDKKRWLIRNAADVIRIDRILGGYDLNANTKAMLKVERRRYGEEIIKCVLRKSVISTLGDPEVRAILRIIFPYPWSEIRVLFVRILRAKLRFTLSGRGGSVHG